MLVPENLNLSSVSGNVRQLAHDPFGYLSDLVGTWKGKGLNQIWRPFHGSQDRFLELNETDETLVFEVVSDSIANRGLLQGDINLAGLHYQQAINDAHAKVDGKVVAIHFEPGLWLAVPKTTNPDEPATVARLATIPHGTTINMQGEQLPILNGPPPIAPVSIVPFVIGQPSNLIHFPETNLGIASAFRTPPADIPGFTQAMVNNPNVVLNDALAGKTVLTTKTLRVSSTPLPPPTAGGGTANIAFLQGAAGGPNAATVKVDAIFWIEHVRDEHGAEHMFLQYSQTVFLNFNGLTWPHVSVATLVKQP